MMEHATDIELVWEYAKRGSEEAFTTLVRRHVNFVYSAALRQVRDVTAAEEITQAAFIVLSRKAHKLDERTIVSAWLYRTTRFAAADFLKIRARRLKYEQEAAQMERETSDAAWSEIEPFLDEAVNRLGETDRAAVLLRFFENKSLREVGTALGVSDDTAQKRITRAIERLRKIFERDGVKLSAGALAVMLPAETMLAAPHALALSITKAVAPSAMVSASTTILVKGTLQMIAWTKFKFAAGFIALLVLGAGTVSLIADKLLPDEPKADPRATAQEDRSTPLGALRYLARALETFDEQKLSECFFTGTPTQARFASAMASVVGSEGQLRKALEETFGTNGVASMPKQPVFTMSFGQDKFNEADIQINGTNAVARIPTREQRSAELRLVKIGPLWKLDGGKSESPQATETSATMEALARGLQSFTEEVRTGSFPTAEVALRAMRGRIGPMMRTRPQDALNR
jgi:RNA polymerase sigma factor (sigma-70 family)